MTGTASGPAGASTRPGLPPGMSRRAAQAIVRRYQAGESMDDLSRDLRRPSSVISQTLGALGVRLKVNQPRRLLPREDLVELYVSRGLSSEAVGLALGVSSQKVRDDLRYHGIALRPRNPRPAGVSVRAAELRRLYLSEGLSVEQIAARLGCSRGAVIAAMDRFGIARMRGKRIREDEEAVRAALVELYQNQGLSIAGVARAMGRSHDYVSVRLRRYGIARRPAPPRASADPELLRRAWVDERRTLEEIAGELGTSRSQLRAELSRHGITRPRRRPRLAAVTRQSLEELYVGRALSASEVARRLGCSPNWVCDQLHLHGIPLRPRNWRPGQPADGLTREDLEALYLDQRLSVEEVAACMSCSGSSIYNALRRFDIPIRPRREPVAVSLSAEEMRALYVEQRLSEEQIAARLGTSAWQVRLRRRTLRVRRPASPPPHPPPVTSPGPEVLQELYAARGLTLVEIARRYHTSGPKVRAWLVDAGIPVAPRTTRATRIDLPAEALEVLYVEMEMSMREVAAELDVQADKVRRALHDHGIPVRPTRRRGVPALRLIEQLYADSEVALWLVKHQLPARPEPGTLSERFPQPVPLSRELLVDSYVRIGLSAQHIEMLTGQPMEQVLDALVAFAIPVRTEQGISPWRRRLLESLHEGERRDRAS